MITYSGPASTRDDRTYSAVTNHGSEPAHVRLAITTGPPRGCPGGGQGLPANTGGASRRSRERTSRFACRPGRSAFSASARTTVQLFQVSV